MSELFKNLVDPTAPEETPKIVLTAPPVAIPPVVVPPQEETAPLSADSDMQVDELTMLKARARMMGIDFSNNIGLDSLKEKIKIKLENKETANEMNAEQIQAEKAEVTSDIQPERKISIREYMQETQMKLVRLRITNLDPKKKDLPGEIFTVANEYLGSVTKYIPYGEVTDGGYHVPYVIYQQLKDRVFLSIKTKKGKRGETIVENQWAKEFALDVLDPLSELEIAKLATAQQAAGSVE